MENMYTAQPFHEDFLPDLDGHNVYYAQYGNPDGVPIISFHGGPGSQSKAKYAQTFDLETYRVVLFDQRGCGKSTPQGEIKHNTTQDLLTDTERIRAELGIDNWFVTGGSWGSTLALMYGIEYTKSTRGLLLSSIFLADAASDAWAFGDQDGVARLFPDGWAEMQHRLAELGISGHISTPQALLQKLQSEDQSIRMQAAAIVGNWEVNLLSRNIPLQYRRPEELSESDVASITIFLHYQANQYFLPDGYIIKNLSQIVNLPTVIVHGRYDILCPLQAAWNVHKELPRSEFVALPESHHSLSGDGSIARQYIFQAFLEKQTYQTNS